jgi:hypothetical protein
VVVAYVSSVTPVQLLPSDLILDPTKPEFRSTQLKTTSVLRLHKWATIHCSSFARLLGELNASSLNLVAIRLKELLGF